MADLRSAVNCIEVEREEHVKHELEKKVAAKIFRKG